ncbi:IGHMBP2 family helicase [Sphingobacterium sp. MYb382]|uniref:IGHMBP2 family helicase n=1 Tax=Sphingobacterium sp. MYb382 TaxID=2745278 RepID=UPI0030ACB823
MNYFEALTILLSEEQAYDKQQHETLLFKSSLQERKEQGVTWFPIAITQSELGRGDYLTITVSKTNNLAEGHKFRFGMPVSLFSNHDANEDRVNGIISYVSRDTMRISFKFDELPDWSRRGKLGVDLLFDENSYKEMQDALVEAEKLRADKTHGEFVRQLIGESPLREHVASATSSYNNAHLNASQNLAIQQVLAANPLTILHGPPGTGKTTTLVHAVKALVKQDNEQILLVAPSNTAVDLLTERLSNQGIDVVRIGNPVKVSAHLQELTLDAKVENHQANKESKTLAKQARAYMDMAQKYKRSFGRSEREQRKALMEESRKIRKEIDKIQDYVVEDVLSKAAVITATLVGANQHTIRNRHYQTLIIDEAAQALEPACWIPLLKANRVVLAGDHCQLPPTVKATSKAGQGLYVTLFEKLVNNYPSAVSLLNVQYRMNSQIMKYPSDVLYKGALQAAPAVADWSLPQDNSPIIFIDTAGAGFEETQIDNGTFNGGEAYFLRQHLSSMVQDLAISSANGDTEFPSIGVVAPYRKQAGFLKEIIAEDDSLKPYEKSLQIHTIDSFQGQEKDIIYISLTRSNGQQQIGFLSDIRRMNVAMTRAKKKLVVIGDSSTIGQHPFYKGLLDYVTSLDAYHSVWEWDITGFDA